MENKKPMEQLEQGLERLRTLLPMLTDMEKAQLLGMAQGLAMAVEKRQAS